MVRLSQELKVLLSCLPLESEMFKVWVTGVSNLEKYNWKDGCFLARSSNNEMRQTFGKRQRLEVPLTHKLWFRLNVLEPRQKHDKVNLFQAREYQVDFDTTLQKVIIRIILIPAFLPACWH